MPWEGGWDPMSGWACHARTVFILRVSVAGMPATIHLDGQDPIDRLHNMSNRVRSVSGGHGYDMRNRYIQLGA